MRSSLSHAIEINGDFKGLPHNKKTRDALFGTSVVIFFSLTEAPLTDPTTTPPNTPETHPKRTRNGPETEPNGAKRSRNGPKSSPLGWDGRGGLSGWGGVGVVREKEYHYTSDQVEQK